LQGHREARREKDQEGGGTHRRSCGGNGATVSLQIKIQSPPTVFGRGRGSAPSRVKRPGDGENRCRREGGPRRRKFSGRLVRRRIARGGGAEEEERVGVKRGELPPLPYLYRGAAVVGMVVVLHYPDRFYKHRHVVARRGAAVPITVPLRQLWQ
jgi:hypothetical protein